MKKTVFEYQSYKSFLRDYIDEQGVRGIVSKLAQAGGCDRTYLSQALNSKVQLIPDHILGICEYIGLSELEENYLLHLLLIERSVNISAKQKLKSKLKQIEESAQKVSSSIEKKELLNELSEYDKSVYYSSWLFSAIHILTSEERFQSISSISERLQISKEIAKDVLSQLTSMGLIYKKGSAYKHSGKNIHVPSGSPHYLTNHSQWRGRAQLNAANNSGIHYTSVFTIAKSDLPQIKSQVLKLIDNQRQVISQSGTEDLYSFCCDLFRV